MHNYDDMTVVLNHLHDLGFNNKTNAYSNGCLCVEYDELFSIFKY